MLLFAAQAHPNLSKQERKTLCRLMDSRKLSAEASFHAAQNERLPVRAVIQVLFSEHKKLSHHIDWSGSFNEPCSPGARLDQPTRCFSKREASTAQQAEIRRLREDLNRLQGLCNVMQGQIERMRMEKKKGLFRWKKLGLIPPLRSSSGGIAREEGDGGEVELGFGRLTPVDMKTKLIKGRSDRTPPKWRRSMS